VIVNEKTGTVVIGERVQIGTVAISHGSISVQVKGTSSAGDAAGQNGDKSKGEKVAILKKGTNVGDLVKTLNTLGVGPKDLITILQSIKAAGALPAELEVL
jgi:flagellar P-ring protein precursor FlgI